MEILLIGPKTKCDLLIHELGALAEPQVFELF